MKTIFLQACMGLTMMVAASGQAPTVSSVADPYSGAQNVVAPGGELQINGANLALSNQSCLNTAKTAYLTTCNGTSVFIDGYAAPIQGIKPAQLTIYAPMGLPVGAASLVVTTSAGSSAGFSMSVAPAAPSASLFYDHAVLVSSQNPAQPGDAIFIYATGFGVTTPQPVDGQVIPANAQYPAAGVVAITVGGIRAYIPAAPNLWAIDQFAVTFYVPQGLSGNQPVVITVDGIASPPATLQLAGSPSSLSVTTGSDLGTFPVGEVQVALAAAGGNGSYNWTLQSGSLPPGLSIRGDLPLYVVPWAATGLIGVATTPGTYNFSLAITSGPSNTMASFTIKITGLTLRDGPTLPDGFAGTPYYNGGYQLTATKSGSPESITCTPGATDGLTLSNTCLLSGSPTAAGYFTIPVTFTNGADTLKATLNLTVYIVNIPDPGELPNTVKNQPYSYTIAPAGEAPFSYSLYGQLPAGLTWTGPTISGTPTGALGKTNFSFTVLDAEAHFYTKSMSIDVIGTPEALPQISPYGDLGDCTVGVGCSFAIAVSSGGAAPFTWTATGLPPGMGFRFGSGKTLGYVNAGDLELWGTPTQTGYYPVTVTAIDANGMTVTQIFPLRVSPLLFDPCVDQLGCSLLQQGVLGTAYATVFRIVGGAPPYNAVLSSSRNVPNGLPDGLRLSPTAVTGIPLENGQFSPFFVFSDSAAGTNTLNVSEPLLIYYPSGGSTTIDYYPTQYAVIGEPYSLQLAACCAGYAWTAPVTGPPLGTTLSGSGLLSGIPTQEGTSFSLLQATDSRNSANYGTRLLVFMATSVSISTNSLPSATVNVAYNQSLSATGNGGIVWRLTYGSLLPPGLSLNQSGAITGTPLYPGAYSFDVLALDSTFQEMVKTVSMSVYTLCDLTKAGTTTVPDVQQLVNEALGNKAATDDLNADNRVNVVDIEIASNSVLRHGCSAH